MDYHRKLHKQGTNMHVRGCQIVPGRTGPVCVTALPVLDERPGTERTRTARSDFTYVQIFFNSEGRIYFKNLVLRIENQILNVYFQYN